MVGAVVLGDLIEADCRQIAVDREKCDEPLAIADGGSKLLVKLGTKERNQHNEKHMTSVEYRTGRRASLGPALRVKRNGRLLQTVFLKSLSFEYLGFDDDVEPDMQFLRVSGVTTDRMDSSSFPFVRLIDLPLPACLQKEQQAKGKRGGGS